MVVDWLVFLVYLFGLSLLLDLYVIGGFCGWFVMVGCLDV